MDTIFIRDLQLKTLIGVFEWEKQVPQTLSLDIDLHYSRRPINTLDDAINYAKVIEKIEEFTNKQHYELLETLAEELAKLFFKEFSIESCRIRLNKTGIIATCKAIGIEINREKTDFV